MSWDRHVQYVLKSGYGALKSLKAIKRFTPFNIRKNLASCLVLSKIKYANIVYSDVLEYQFRRLQKLQNSAASFVINKYARPSDVVNLSWLPIKEDLELSIAKAAHNSLYSATWPAYLKNRFQQQTRQLRNIDDRLHQIENERTHHTFNSDCCRVFNDLPMSCRSSTNFNEFTRLTKSYLLDIALARNIK